MNILNDRTDICDVAGVQVEQVQQQKQEYYLLGTFLRTKGLRLFYYNPANGETKEVVIKYSDTLHLYKMPDGNFITIDWEYQKCTVDARCVYFECLNLRSALERVCKWKWGAIKELFNMRKPNPEGINFFN